MTKFSKTSKTQRLRKRLFFQYERQDFAGAVRLGEALLRAHIQHGTSTTTAYDDDMYNTALANAAAGNVDRAVELYTESIHRIFNRLGAGLPVACCLTNLAALLSSYDQHESACRIFMQALTIRRRLLPYDHLELGDALYNMGNALIRADKCKDAIPALMSALHIYNKKNSTNLIDCLHVIAVAHIRLGEYEQALPFAEAAWQRTDKTDKTDKIDETNKIDKTNMPRDEEGTEGVVVAEAERAEKIERAGKSETNEKDVAEHHQAGFFLAQLYELGGQHDEACQLYLSTMDWVEKTVGLSHSSYINIATKTAAQLAKLGSYIQAKDILMKILKSIEVMAGHDNLTYSNCIRNLAVIHQQLKEWEEAETLLRESIAIKERIIGEHADEFVGDLKLLDEIVSYKL